MSVERPMPVSEESKVVFNIVWTGRVFDHLQMFAASQMAHSGARFRFIANACPPDQLDAMERFAADHPGRVTDIVQVSIDRMIRHGQALDEAFRQFDDGEFFAFIDPDILARAPFLGLFRSALIDHDAVTSGKEVWSDTNVRPADHPGVNGEYFFDQDGFVFGSPHLAIYRREPLADTLDRWNVGFGVAGNDISREAKDMLDSMGRGYWVFDTGKIVNILFQADGHSLCHEENPDLVHIGGVSHFLAPPSSAPAALQSAPAWGEGPDWGEQKGMAGRFEVARYTASVLSELCDGRAAPPVPDEVDPSMRERLVMVRGELIDLLASVEAPTEKIFETGSAT